LDRTVLVTMKDKLIEAKAENQKLSNEIKALQVEKVY
jgi:hypothetical protein